MIRQPQQIALAPRVLWEITVTKHGRGIYMSTIAGNAFGHRRASLEMARIVCAQHPGARLNFRRLPMDGVR